MAFEDVFMENEACDTISSGGFRPELTRSNGALPLLCWGWSVESAGESETGLTALLLMWQDPAAKVDGLLKRLAPLYQTIYCGCGGGGCGGCDGLGSCKTNAECVRDQHTTNIVKAMPRNTDMPSKGDSEDKGEEFERLRLPLGLRVEVLSTSSDCDRMVQEMHQRATASRERGHASVLGLDTEWASRGVEDGTNVGTTGPLPSSPSVAVLQLADDHACLLIQIKRCCPLPPSLGRLLSDPGVIKAHKKP